MAKSPKTAPKAPAKAPAKKPAPAKKVPEAKKPPVGKPVKPPKLNRMPVRFEKFLTACLLDEKLREIMYEHQPVTKLQYDAEVETAKTRMLEIMEELDMPRVATAKFIHSFTTQDFKDFAEAARDMNDLDLTGA